MTSVEEICNLALSHLKCDGTITNILNDNTAEGKARRRVYETARDAVLADAPWPFAKKIADLMLVEEAPNSRWSYSYRYPSDCIGVRRILSGFDVDSRATRVPFELGIDGSGQLIYSSVVNAELEYTMRVENVSYFSARFAMALSYLMAVYMAPILAGDTKYGVLAKQLYDIEIDKAKANAFNEVQDHQDPQSEFIDARN